MKNKILLLLAMAGISMFGWQCQYELESITQPQKDRFLVFTADLTETYGRVRVEYSSEETQSGKILDAPSLAGTAYVVDSKGNKTVFDMSGKTNTQFKGVVGETYQLFIETEGKKYESLVETMPRCPEVDTVTSVFNVSANISASSRLKNGYDVIVKTKDLTETGNYYQWDWVHYERKRFCGARADPKNRNEIRGLQCLGDCFFITYNPKLNILSDALVNGKALEIPILRVEYATPPLKYYLQIEQRAITKNAYNYYQSVVIQTQNNGNQFDVPAQTLFSTNIKCTTKPDEKVLGVFNLFSSRKRILIIDRSILYPGITRITDQPGYKDYIIAPTEPPFPYPGCGDETRYNTTVKPEGWVD